MRLLDYTSDMTASADRNNSVNVATRAGINGALTQSLGFTLGVGYTAGFVQNSSDYEGVSAQVEARWRIRETVLWAVGYDRDYTPAFQGNFDRLDRLKTRLQMMLGGAFLLALRGEVTFVDFGYDAVLASRGADGNRNDIQLLVNLAGEYRIVDWFALTAEIGYLQDFTDYVFPPTTTGGMPDPAEYKQFQGWFGVRAFL